MKRVLLATIASTLLSAHAAENFGSVSFHSSVPKDQIESMKVDLRYLYSNLVLNVDKEFITTAEINVGDGPNMHNWLVNRVRYVVGEKFELDETNLLVNMGYVFPKTPMPESGNSSRLNLMLEEPAPTNTADSSVKTIMSNLGGALYITGKTGLDIYGTGKLTQVALGVNFDGAPVYATSARMGLLKVGIGLFFEKFNISPELNAPANSVNRLATFFHEARHSDGTGKNTGFMHATCPKTHAYAGYFACEKVSNGPYTIGALSTRALTNNCTTCTEKEKTALAALTLDSFSRVLSASNAALRLADYQAALKIYDEVIATNKLILSMAKTDAEKAKIEAEIKRLENLVASMKDIVEDLKKDATLINSPGNATPEGYFVPVSLKASMNSMTVKK